MLSVLLCPFRNRFTQRVAHGQVKGIQLHLSTVVCDVNHQAVSPKEQEKYGHTSHWQECGATGRLMLLKGALNRCSTLKSCLAVSADVSPQCEGFIANGAGPTMAAATSKHQLKSHCSVSDEAPCQCPGRAVEYDPVLVHLLILWNS